MGSRILYQLIRRWTLEHAPVSLVPVRLFLDAAEAYAAETALPALGSAPRGQSLRRYGAAVMWPLAAAPAALLALGHLTKTKDETAAMVEILGSVLLTGANASEWTKEILQQPGRPELGWRNG
jgi:hypothetical protein